MDSANRFLHVPLVNSEQMRSRPCPVPAAAGVYGWWFDEIPTGVPAAGCKRRGEWTLLYVGISPKAPPRNGAAPSRQTLRSRVRYHFHGNAEGSTLRLTLGVLLAEHLRIELRRVGSGTRHTFSLGEQQLSAWMAEHARVSVLEYPTPWTLEEELIGALDLPLNLDQNRNHSFHNELSARRRAARMAAAELPVLLR